MKIHFMIGLLIGAAINLAFQVSDIASTPGKQFDFSELSICAALAALAALLPALVHPHGRRRVAGPQRYQGSNYE